MLHGYCHEKGSNITENLEFLPLIIAHFKIYRIHLCFCFSKLFLKYLNAGQSQSCLGANGQNSSSLILIWLNSICGTFALITSQTKLFRTGWFWKKNRRNCPMLILSVKCEIIHEWWWKKRMEDYRRININDDHHAPQESRGTMNI